MDAEHARLVGAGRDHTPTSRIRRRSPEDRASDGLSRTSTEAKKASMSTWRMAPAPVNGRPAEEVEGPLGPGPAARLFTHRVATSGTPRHRRTPA